MVRTRNGIAGPVLIAATLALWLVVISMAWGAVNAAPVPSELFTTTTIVSP